MKENETFSTLHWRIKDSIFLPEYVELVIRFLKACEKEYLSRTRLAQMRDWDGDFEKCFNYSRRKQTISFL